MFFYGQPVVPLALYIIYIMLMEQWVVHKKTHKNYFSVDIYIISVCIDKLCQLYNHNCVNAITFLTKIHKLVKVQKDNFVLQQ